MLHLKGITIDKVASIPFRFKFDSAMAPALESHHHRSTSKVAHKPFKSRHSTKGYIKDLAKGKVEGFEKGSRKTPHQQVISKIDRRHQARQLKQSKHKEHIKASSVFLGQNGAPRIVAIVPLCEENDSQAAMQKLSYEDHDDNEIQENSTGFFRVRVDRFKQNILFVPVERNLIPALDACRVADFVIFLLSPTQGVDAKGEIMLRAIESQGVSSVFTMVQNLENLDPPKRRLQAVASLKSYITHFFPAQEKVYSLDIDRERVNVLRSICTTAPKGINWRDDRSWMFVEKVDCSSKDNQTATHGEVVITGVVRGRGLKANRLVQVGDWGRFQINKITASTLPHPRKRKADDMSVDLNSNQDQTLEMPDEGQDDLINLAPYDATMKDMETTLSEMPAERLGVLLDDHHYFPEDEAHTPKAPERLPRGTSSYQSAWYLDDVSDSSSDPGDAVDGEGDIVMSTKSLPQDGTEGLDQFSQPDPTEATPSEYPPSEMFLDPSPDEEALQLASYRSKKKTEAEDDFEFPDEIELHPKTLARERLARYRGLKSLKTSCWETNEDKAHEPEDWDRLLRVPDYKKAKKQAIREALAGGVSPGKRVNVHLHNVPLSLPHSKRFKNPLFLVSLLRHEQKHTVLNFSMTLNSDYPHPLRSKDELILQCGPRRLVINPLYSQTGNTPNNVHKFQRYLHPGQTAMATFVGPLTWGSVPALFFKRKVAPEKDPLSFDPASELELIATGTSQPPDRSRVIAKRIILTGHPYKIHKKLVTVRYMFFNVGDVNWFKALPLWTKRGRSGFIKESLGTHGYFKATFDGKINPQDAVGVSLYKRVFPRNARPWPWTETDGGEDEFEIAE